MGRFKTGVFLTLPVLSLLGSGCLENPPLLKAAESFTIQEAPPSAKQGFGKLPAIQFPRCTAKVTILGNLPELPATVTVLKLKPGAPSDTELYNIAAAIKIPWGVVGQNQKDRDLSLSWKDERGMNWSYLASERLLTFVSSESRNSSSTINNLPENGKIQTMAADFLENLHLPHANYAESKVAPDWNAWRASAESLRQCLTPRGLTDLKKNLATTTPFDLNPPVALPRNNYRCVKFEFPSWQIVRYALQAQDYSIVDENAQPLYGMEVAVDAKSGAVVQGRIKLLAEPEKSDYPAISEAAAKDLLLQCGLSNATGDLVFYSFRRAYLMHQDFLIPSLVASGAHKLKNGTTEPYRVVVPLVDLK